MTVPIFWRLILGYSLILILALGLSFYSILQLGRLSGAAQAVLSIDNRMIAYEEKLADAILSEVRYGRKYIITQASTLHDQFRQFKQDFSQHLGELGSLADSPDMKARLARVQELHVRYHDLFDQEVQYLQARQTYAETRYREEKDKTVEGILEELEILKAHAKKNVHDKLKTIEMAGRSTRRVALLATLALLGLGVVLAAVISRSITEPISELKRRAAEETTEGLERDAKISHVPEIQGLADTLNTMRRKLYTATRMKSDFLLAMSERFVTPLISIRERLRYLREELAGVVTADQRKKFEILAEECERLVRLFSKLSESSEGGAAVKAHTEHIRGVSKKDSVARARNKWISVLKKLSEQTERKSKGLVATAGRIVAASWNTLRGSLDTLWHGRAKKY